MNTQELLAARVDAVNALTEYAEAGKNPYRKNIARNEASSAIKRVIDLLADDAAERVPQEFKNEIIRKAKIAAKQQAEEMSKAPAYTAALEGAFAVIKAQGVELSEDSVVEVVKAVTEYQCKVVEAQSYKDWIETKTEGQRGR